MKESNATSPNNANENVLMYLHIFCHMLQNLKYIFIYISNFILHIAVTLAIDLSVSILKMIRIHIEYTVLPRLAINFALNSSNILLHTTYSVTIYCLSPSIFEIS